MMYQDIVTLLSNEFKEWSCTIDPDNKNVILIEGDLENKISSLFKFLEKLDIVDDNNLNISISKSDNYSVEIKFSQDIAKYNRMYTSGCFDIFHYGHLSILRKTKALCNYLVVGVSTDELILKEKGRLPLIPFEERINVLRAISFVDKVIPQIDKNKQHVVDTYKIDAISVGDDWLGRFPKTSCPVEYFPYTKSVSSTILKEALKLQEKS